MDNSPCNSPSLGYYVFMEDKRFVLERVAAASILGSKKGGKKAKAARENGKKGGRPVVRKKKIIKK